MTMTSAIYYPEQRLMLPLTLIRRERVLPEGVGEARLETSTGARVSLRDVVVRGALPAPYTALEAASLLKLRQPTDLPKLLLAAVGDHVEEGQLLARRRRRKLVAPVSGVITLVEDGRVLIKTDSTPVEVTAGVNGQVLDVDPARGILIETYGALLQGVWGNGKRAMGALRFEPADGLDDAGDALGMQYRGTIVVSKRRLKPAALTLMQTQGVAGLIAPSMEADMREAALRAPGPVLLIEGFGTARLNPAAQQFLSDFEGRQATVDAVRPTLTAKTRPEVIITVPLPAVDRPAPPVIQLSLQTGLQVRVMRSDGSSIAGQITGLPEGPMLLDNGLRVPCAQVELITGERMPVPLANIEVFGR
jgi:hypothetical protein